VSFYVKYNLIQEKNMTQKIYKTARGKSIDIGSLRLQNENVRAVGNMGVNARGDRIDSKGAVIDSRNKQLQRRIQKQTNVSDGPVHSDMFEADRALQPDTNLSPQSNLVDNFDDLPQDDIDNTISNTPVAQTPPNTNLSSSDIAGGGLAAAIARSKTVKQELDKTPLEKFRDQGVRKI